MEMLWTEFSNAWFSSKSWSSWFLEVLASLQLLQSVKGFSSQLDILLDYYSIFWAFTKAGLF